ncbi:MAG: DNA polymerase III subunit delta [Spirochaetota bacterium]|nr:DNA polymerase III subunit delta [Spirochaetota bacterium]
MAKFPTSRELNRDLDKNKIEKIYLFIGEEEGEKEKIINRIIDMVFLDKEEGNYSVGRYHIENGEFIEAIEHALSQSVFSNMNICIMFGIQHLNSTKYNKTLMMDLLNNLPDSNILIMTSSENRLPELLNRELMGDVKVFHFWKHFENNLYGYIAKSLREHGLNIEDGATHLLIELVGRDIKKIDEAIEKIIYSGEKDHITLSFIRSFINDEKDISIFDFIDALFKKEKRAFNLLKKLIEDGVHELVILRMISREVERIERYHFLLKEGLEEKKIIDKLGIIPRSRANFLEYVQRNTPDDISRIFTLIFRSDYRIKSENYSRSMLSNPIFELVTDILFYKTIISV